MWTAQDLQSSSSDAHGDLVGMFSQLEDTHFDQELADVEARLQDTKRAHLGRIPLEHIADGQQDYLVVNAAIAGYVEGGAGRLGLVHARIIDMRVRVGAQHLAAVTGGGAAHASAAIASSIAASNAAAITQGIQLGVNGSLGEGN